MSTNFKEVPDRFNSVLTQFWAYWEELLPPLRFLFDFDLSEVAEVRV